MSHITIGYQYEQMGAVALHDGVLVYLGPQSGALKEELGRIRRYYPQDDDAAFYARIPRILNNGYYWAHPVPPPIPENLTPPEFDRLNQTTPAAK